MLPYNLHLSVSSVNATKWNLAELMVPIWDNDYTRYFLSINENEISTLKVSCQKTNLKEIFLSKERSHKSGISRLADGFL